MSFSNKYGNDPNLINYVKSNTVENNGGSGSGTTGPTGPTGPTGSAGSFDEKEYSLFSPGYNTLNQSPRFVQNQTFWGSSHGGDIVSISSSGQIQFACGGNSVWKSIDYGKNWDWTNLPSRKLRCCKVSGTGQYITMVGIKWNNGTTDYPACILRSNDFGNNFTEIKTSSIVDWNSVSMSFSGQYQTASTTNSKLYRSDDYGTTWVEITNIIDNSWRSITMSVSGKYQYVCGPEHVYKSQDYGLTWTELITDLPLNKPWHCISTNETGQYIYLLSSANNEYIYRSDTFGETWKQVNPNTFLNSISTSSTGQYVIAAGDYCYWSSDYGNTFSSFQTGYTDFLSVSINSSGEYYSILRNTGGDDGSSYMFTSVNNIRVVNRGDYSNYSYPAISFNNNNNCGFNMKDESTTTLRSYATTLEFGPIFNNNWVLNVATGGASPAQLYWGPTDQGNYITFNPFSSPPRFEFYTNFTFVGSIP